MKHAEGSLVPAPFCSLFLLLCLGHIHAMYFEIWGPKRSPWFSGTVYPMNCASRGISEADRTVSSTGALDPRLKVTLWQVLHIKLSSQAIRNYTLASQRVSFIWTLVFHDLFSCLSQWVDWSVTSGRDILCLVSFKKPTKSTQSFGGLGIYH